MEMIVDLQEKKYPIYIEKGILKKIDTYISKFYNGQKIMVISDDNVFPLYGDEVVSLLSKQYDVASFVVKHGEQAKDFSNLLPLYDALMKHKVTRTDLVIALGGGVIGDLVGFVSATYLRGVNFVQVPTSLLAQVDSSVGGKVGVDARAGKNLIGAFHHPKMVLIDPLTLQTLTPHFIADGMAEVIKYGCIKEKSLFDQLLTYNDFTDLYQDIEEIIYRCVDIKRIVVEKDQFDFGDRILLNFGHTLAHAIEQYFNYETYSHGEAVGIGMYQLTKIAETNNLTKIGTAKQIKDILEKYNLPLSSDVKTSKLVEAISLDKKNINKTLSYVLLHEIGDSYLFKNSPDFILQVDKV